MGSVDMDAQVDLSGLTSIERELLRVGVMEWERSDVGRERVVQLLGFEDRSTLKADVERLAGLIKAASSMSRRDCRRALLATELAFSSETVGWARDWSADTGFADRETITVLRSVQEKIAGIVHGSVDGLVAIEHEAQPAWCPISMDDDDEYWAGFYQRFAFRPGMSIAEPAISEPAPSVTLDLSPICSARDVHEAAAGMDAVNSLALLAWVRVLAPETSLVVLDWQHQTHRFWPHRHACQPDPQWQTEVFPNGDYYVFLTEDMSTGTFGHPWQQTLCVFGEPLVSALVPMLASWLPVKRDNR
jgi:hypothetical protein